MKTSADWLIQVNKVDYVTCYIIVTAALCRLNHMRKPTKRTEKDFVVQLLVWVGG